MKKSLIFCGLLAAFASCKDDTRQLLKTVDGNWKVSTVTYSRVAGPDSIVTPAALTLRFDNCSKTSNNGSPGNCQVAYVDGAKEYPFVYQAQGSPSSVYINRRAAATMDTSYDLLANKFIGSYDLTTLTENTLVMKHEVDALNPMGLSGFKSVQYSAKK